MAAKSADRSSSEVALLPQRRTSSFTGTMILHLNKSPLAGARLCHMDDLQKVAFMVVASDDLISERFRIDGDKFLNIHVGQICSRSESGAAEIPAIGSLPKSITTRSEMLRTFCSSLMAAARPVLIGRWPKPSGGALT